MSTQETNVSNKNKAQQAFTTLIENKSAGQTTKINE